MSPSFEEMLAHRMQAGRRIQISISERIFTDEWKRRSTLADYDSSNAEGNFWLGELAESQVDGIDVGHNVSFDLGDGSPHPLVELVINVDQQFRKDSIRKEFSALTLPPWFGIFFT